MGNESQVTQVMKLTKRPAETTDKIIEIGKTTDCSYPGCRKKYDSVFELDVNNEVGSKAQLPFCWYHFYVVNHNRFNCKKVGDYTFTLCGPFEEVQLTEQIIASIESMKQINKDKDLNKSTD